MERPYPVSGTCCDIPHTILICLYVWKLGCAHSQRQCLCSPADVSHRKRQLCITLHIEPPAY